MRDILRHNLGMKVLAIVSAFFLWLYVAYQNPANEQLLPRVSLEYSSLPKDVAVVSIPKTVSIRIQGAGLLSGDLTYNDVKATVDLAEARVGNNIVSVKVNVPSGARLVSVNPERVNVQLDVVREKQVPVQVGYSGELKAGLKRLSPVMNPEQVLVRGPHALLERVRQAYVVADLAGVDKHFSKNLPVRLMDADGNLISDKSLQLAPTGVEIFIPVVKKLPNKAVEIRPVSKGNPAPGYRIAKVVFDPETVTITGPEAVLNNTNFLETESIDISGAKSDVVKEVRLIGPQDISWAGKGTVKVVVKIEALPLPTNTQKVDIELRNLPKGKSVKVFPAQAQIEWTQEGALTELAVWVDLTGLTVGKHELPLQVTLAPGAKLARVQPLTIQVDIQDTTNPQ